MLWFFFSESHTKSGGEFSYCVFIIVSLVRVRNFVLVCRTTTNIFLKITQCTRLYLWASKRMSLAIIMFFVYIPNSHDSLPLLFSNYFFIGTFVQRSTDVIGHRTFSFQKFLKIFYRDKHEKFQLWSQRQGVNWGDEIWSPKKKLCKCPMRRFNPVWGGGFRWSNLKSKKI